VDLAVVALGRWRLRMADTSLNVSGGAAAGTSAASMASVSTTGEAVTAVATSSKVISRF